MATRAAHTPTAGALAFARFLKERTLSDAKAGALLKVTDVTVLHWRTGAKVPKDVGRRKIEIFTRTMDPTTGNEVPGIPPSAWDDGSEAAALEGVQPFAG